MPTTLFDVKRWLCLAVAVLWLAMVPATAGAQVQTEDPSEAQLQDRSVAARQSPAQLWEDFNHYVLIARPELAAAAAAALLDQTDGDALLDIVEASRFRDYQQTMARALKIATVQDAATKLEATIRAALLSRMRDPQRIREAIDRLDDGRRPRQNAIAELREAGQFAAPLLLEALTDEQRKNLRPYLVTAMVEVGRPLVYPLAEALPHLEPVDQATVSQVLAEIGYPRALPYLKQVMESASTDPVARTAAQAAYNRIAAANDLSGGGSASGLFLSLAANYYDRVSSGRAAPGFDEATQQGVVWEYTDETGLVQIDVPESIFGDVLAMRAARAALALDPGSSQALSLWLAANQRRANNVPYEDYQDPTYREPHAPAYYLTMAGPARQADVLSLALRDGDAQLARDAIAALDKTAGTASLVDGSQTIAPLLESLGAADRRVRYEAAFAVTKARPQQAFAGSMRVVPVLAEAVRQTSERYAVVIGDADLLNTLTATVKAMGYQPIAGATLNGVVDEVGTVSGVDLIVMAASAEAIQAGYYEAQQDYKLAASPFVAAAEPAAQSALNQALGDKPGVFVTAMSSDPQALATAIEPVLAAYAGTPIEAQEAMTYALTALQLLREIALSRAQVYNVMDAEPALLLAMRDARPQVVTAAAQVAALLDDSRAQQALAEVALAATTAEPVRIEVLGSLAESAEYHGNLLTPGQVSRLLDLVMGAEGPTSLAAARAHGALGLSSDHVVQLLNQ